MRKVKFGKTAVAIGLYWANISGDKPKAEIISIKKEISKPYGLIMKVKKENSKDSYQVALTEKKDLNGLVSAAAAIAKLQGNEDIIFIEYLNETEAWIVAISEGEIIIGSDKVISLDESEVYLNNFISEYAKEPVIVVSNKIIETTSISEDSVDDILSFSELFEKSGYTKVSKDFSSVKISTNSDSTKTLVLGAIAAAIVCSIAYSKMPEDKVAPVYVPPEVIKPIVVNNGPQGDELLFENAYKEEKQWLRDDFDKSDPSKTIKRIIAYSMIMDKEIGGWEAISLSYDDSSKNDLFVKWKRKNYGTPLTLRKEIKDSVFLSIPIESDTATSFHEFVDDYEGVVGDIDILEFISSSNYTYESLAHDLISLDLRGTISENEEMERREPIKGLKINKDRKKKQLALSSKHVSIMGENINDLKKLIKVTEKAPTFKLNNISISLEQGASWIIDGDIYEN